MIRDILVHVDGSEDGRFRTRYAVSLAKRLDARLTGIHVMPPAELPPLYKPSAIERELGQVSDALSHDAQSARQIFEAEAAHLPKPEWRESIGDIARGVSKWACYADLVIVGQYEWQGSPTHHLMPIAAEIALSCGRPVLDLPAGIEAPKFSKMIMAWDGSREAARAIHDAIPLAKLFGAVDVLEISTGDVVLGHTEMIEHLRAHGLSCCLIDKHTCADLSEIQIFDEFIRAARCDMFVMGAYSHSRLREYVFGGATHNALLKARVPVLLSH